MFDTPDLGPLCLAPFIASFVGFLVYWIGLVIADKKIGEESKKIKSRTKSLAILTIPLCCWLSVSLNIGVMSPAPWFKPTTRNIVGAWEITEESIGVLEDWHDISIKSHELVFMKDGTFYIENVLSFWDEHDFKDEDWTAIFISGSGVWELGQIEGYQRDEWTVFAHFTELNGESVDITKRFYFEGHLPPYILIPLDDVNPPIMRFHKK